MSATSLIIGCGFLGRRIAERLRARGDRVFGTRTGAVGAASLSKRGLTPLICDVTQPVTLTALKPAIEAETLDVYYLVPSGRTRTPNERRVVAIDGLKHVLAALKNANIRRAVLASSTAVYDNAHGRTVTADTPANPQSPHGQLLAEQEQLWLSAGEGFRVVRLVGIYGPGRVIGAKALRDGAPLVGNPDAILNLIHVDDAASLCITCASHDHAARIELGCDGAHVPRLAYYQYVAQQIGAGEPIVLSDADAERILGIPAQRLKQSSSKVCDNGPTCARTGWQPRYADYREGVAASLPASHRG